MMCGGSANIMKSKIVLTLLALFAIDCATIFFANSIDAGLKADLALAAVNGNAGQAASFRNYAATSNYVFWIVGILNLAIPAIVFREQIKNAIKKMKHIHYLAILLTLAFTGCMKKYDTPEFVEIQANETAYVVPLEDGAQKGVKFDSEEYLETKKVALKRVQIPHRWNQTGRWEADGDWIDTVRVIAVDRTPVTRQWEPGSNADQKGQELPKGKLDQAIWLESMDSIGFSTGFSVTAHIEESDASRFLYSYKSKALREVLDTELRARIQSVASEVSASYKMDTLREKKNELIAKIKEDCIPFFKAKGITITTIGQFGGFGYENEKIQYAIDDTFVAQQAKVKNAALLEAQTDANKRIEMEALALAEAARTKAKGEADGKLSVFKAEADGLQAVNKALSDANQNPALMEVKRLEVQKALAEKWDGKWPQWFMGGGGGNSPGMLFQVQPPTSSPK